MTVVEQWDDLTSNSRQQYLTHGVFRYFGKLPPTVTGRILDEIDVRPSDVVVDVMSGSGTTLVEAGLRSTAAVGIDCNQLSVLVARVKTTPIPRGDTSELAAEYKDHFGEALFGAATLEQVRPSDLVRMNRLVKGIPKPCIRNFDHWFHPDIATLLTAVRLFVGQQTDQRLSNLLSVAFAASIRSCSYASGRTGRLFRETDKKLPNPVAVILKRLVKISDAVAGLHEDPRWTPASVDVLLGDARQTGLEAAYADAVICHPPYFALYRYSSDILRFEMDWLGVSRPATVAREIEDGFKTTNAALVERYISDMADVMAEARRICKPGGHLVVVTADSTLRKQRLQIMDPLVDRAEERAWQLVRRAVRTVRFAQSSYHRSADNEIRRPDDEVLILRAV